jgi:hypothetical protein
MTVRHDLSKASAEEIEGLKQACLEISGKVVAALEHSNNPRAAFRSTVIFECDNWMDTIGEPAIGGKYTDDMRERFYGVVLDALGVAFADVYDKK